MILVIIASGVGVVSAAVQYRMARQWGPRLPERLRLNYGSAGPSESLSKPTSLVLGWILALLIGALSVLGVSLTRAEISIPLLIVAALTELAVFGGIRYLYASNVTKKRKR